MQRRASSLPRVETSPSVAFTRHLLYAFASAEKFAREKGGIVLHSCSTPSESPDAYSEVSSFYSSTEKSRRQLLDLYLKCICESIDDICHVIPGFPDSTYYDHIEKKIKHALRLSEVQPDSLPIDIDTTKLVSLLRSLAEAFHEQHSGPIKTQNWSSEWKPEWRTQNLLWTLLKKLGSVSPPPGPLVEEYQTLKEAAFECLFTGSFLVDTRNKCSFKSTLLQNVPTPGQWDADLSWIGTSVFISMPLASLVHSWDEGNRVRAFWGTFIALFAIVAAGLLFFFTSYKSRYANALLDRAAMGTPFEREKSRLTIKNLRTYLPKTPTHVEQCPSETRVCQVSETSGSVTAQEGTEETEDSEAPAHKENGSVLRLYHASLFVQRIYGSTYIDESWTIGMTEVQLLDAISLVLQTAGALGRQTAAFSFTSLAIASRGVPDPELITSRPLSAALQGSRVSFAIFSFLGALAFTCGMMSAMISDLITRQMAFTQVRNEGTAHAFVEKFIFFIRIAGGLNSCAGMSLFTGVVVFLLSIFRVHPLAVIPLGAAWLVLGSLLIESFFTKFHFWNMSEIFEDVGNLIEDPDLQSPSPIAGTLQGLGGGSCEEAEESRKGIDSARKEWTSCEEVVCCCGVMLSRSVALQSRSRKKNVRTRKQHHTVYGY